MEEHPPYSGLAMRLKRSQTITRVYSATLTLALFCSATFSFAATPSLTDPPPGSTFLSSTVTFQWTGGAGEYFLQVGQSPGGSEFQLPFPTTNLSLTVTGLPLDGSTVYVQLGFRDNRLWHTHDYTYSAVLKTNSTISLSVWPSAGGTVSGAGTFPTGSSRTVTASPQIGYEFQAWTEYDMAVASTENYTFQLLDDRTLVANFSLRSYSLFATSGTNGSVTPSGTIPVSSGQSVLFTATPNSGYCVDKWLTNNISAQIGGAEFILPNVRANTDVQVTFRRKVFQGALHLVAVRDRLEGSILGPQAVYADSSRIYLATYQGALFVLKRDRTANFPLLQTLHFNTVVRSVRGDAERLYVTCGEGLRIFSKSNLSLIGSILNGSNLGSLALDHGSIYLSRYQGQIDVNSAYLFQRKLNPSDDYAIKFDKATLQQTATFGESWEDFRLVAYHIVDATAQYILPAPLNVYGTPDFSSVYADERRVIQTTPGCCGRGIHIYNTNGTPFRVIDRYWVNTVRTEADYLISGGEDGCVELYNLDLPQHSPVASLNLPNITGFTGPAEIEIRALWMDNHDDLVFAGSSWSRPESTLPSFYVIERDLPAPPKMISAHLSSAGALVSFSGDTATGYSIQRAPNPSGPWLSVGSTVLTNGVGNFLDPNPLPSSGFYRVVTISD